MISTLPITYTPPPLSLKSGETITLELLKRHGLKLSSDPENNKTLSNPRRMLYQLYGANIYSPEFNNCLLNYEDSNCENLKRAIEASAVEIFLAIGGKHTDLIAIGDEIECGPLLVSPDDINKFDMS